MILHHTAITYGGSGGWYYREQPNASSPLLLLFNAVNQSWFMGFFFLLAGYYTPASVERKGPRRYFLDRLLRLGVPLLVYFFLLSTLTLALARTGSGHPFWPGWLDMIHAREFGPGPLWFAEALLLFAAVYLLWRQFRPPSSTPVALPSPGKLALIAFVLGLLNFAVRLVWPVGHEFLWLQLGYFPCYIFLFIAGCLACRSRLLENITARDARPWLIVSALIVFILPAAAVTHALPGNFDGGWNLNALLYAFWDPFLAPGIILGLLWFAQTRWSRPTVFSTALAPQAFAAYAIHPPVVVACSLAAASLPLAPLLKFVLVGTCACAVSFLLGSLLRRIHGVARIL